MWGMAFGAAKTNYKGPIRENYVDKTPSGCGNRYAGHSKISRASYVAPVYCLGFGMIVFGPLIATSSVILAAARKPIGDNLPTLYDTIPDLTAEPIVFSDWCGLVNDTALGHGGGKSF
ncbi:hypothetical protein PspLS_06376 [Pyricularia sp. CBS 133598]|nr:hypothetical protein PspLS_06376 [Pyricularia sp. CBS 133598]